ncbi:MAG: hypothetical protein Q9205_002935 [Flavoplaca limonia]
MTSKPASRPFRLASAFILLLSQGLALAQGTKPLRQPGIAPSCNAFVTANSGDICVDTAQAAGITLAQLTMWNPVLGEPEGENCPTQFLAGYEYCVGVSQMTTTNTMTNMTANMTTQNLAPSSLFTLNATNATFTPFQQGAPIAAFNGSFYIGVDPLVTCQDCPNNGYLFSVSGDRCATVSPISGPHKMFVSESSGALGYGEGEGGSSTGEEDERMEKGFTYTEGGFIQMGDGIFDFGVILEDNVDPLGWEACEVKGMEGVWRVFVQGIGRGREGPEGEVLRGGEDENCVEFLAVGTGV